MNQVTTTKRTIGKTTYIVAASHSDRAKDTIEKKIETLIVKDMRQVAAQHGNAANLTL